MKPEEIRNMTENEVAIKIRSLREEMFKLTQEAKAGRIEKPHMLKIARRDIARCKTILKEKEIGKK
ncbi:MAG: 50S ribosomal protein L29 [Candidatus Omnitrophica bacterium CG07_land_8_20_14_0_80_42_15]|uniref:Large ribosomal subunit protein uL29 n=1 Tax=Candidatus Aquitaenariimonas noxiae TaxID=1974741 RepID=A0A2J0KYN3_9BACT|nr:MAG: 50S ribosomal protein L29 [Candidatus Omnitrophica bacterium CG07_land_8_20_14_0_80_42_15]